MVAKKVSIINMKGGVGKTTLSINLAMYLSEIDKQRVLLIDLDPQANATKVMMTEEEYETHLKEKKTLSHLFIQSFMQYGPFQPKKQQIKNKLSDYTFRRYSSTDGKSYLDIVPSKLDLSSILRGVNVGPYELANNLIDGNEENYDYIIVDCAPTNSILTTLALVATQSILIPVMADSFAVYGVELMKKVIQDHEDDYGIKIKDVGVVFTMWDIQRPANQEKWHEKVGKTWGLNIFKTRIRKSDWYKVANGERESFLDTPAHNPVKKELISFISEFKIKVA